MGQTCNGGIMKVKISIKIKGAIVWQDGFLVMATLLTPSTRGNILDQVGTNKGSEGGILRLYGQ